MDATTIAALPHKSPQARRAMLARGLAWALIAAIGIWLLSALVSGPQRFVEATIVGVNNGALYALIALGYTLVYGIIELINFSHGDLFMLATVLSAFFIITLFGATSPAWSAIGVIAISLVLVMAAAATLNVAAERLAYRRLRRAPKLAPLITAVGLSFVYQWGGVTWNGSGQRPWPRILDNRGIDIGEVHILWSTIVVVGVTIPLLLLMTWIVQNTRQGKAMRATAQDQDAARLMGIDVDRTIAFTFGLGGAMAGAAGLLYLESIGTTRWDAGFRLGLIAFTAAVLGGIGNLKGAVVGGFLIGIIQNFNESFGLGQKWSQTVVFTILIVVLVFKPEGLLGTASTEKV